MKFIKLTTLLFCTFLSFCLPVHAFRFVVCGDSRSATIDPPFNTEVLTYINSQITGLQPVPDFLFFLGDSVRRAQVTVPVVHSYLHDWHDFMTSTLNGIPLYMVLGNSDIYGDTGWTEASAQAAYQLEFNTMPDNGPSDLYKYMTYSFEYGEGNSRTLFVVLDSYLVSGATHNDNNIDSTQIAWFKQQTAASSANHKMVLSHAPFFSTEGWPVGNGVRQIWDNATSYELFFCSHEHIYSRWSLYPATATKGLQILSGTNGAPIDPNDSSHYVNSNAHPYYGYNFVVVDVEGNNILLRAYGVTDNGDGSFTTRLIDTARVAK
ncbi:MAG: metallophosphoesterase [Chlamydiota bacterium]